jgi:hypothetical protein
MGKNTNVLCEKVRMLKSRKTIYRFQNKSANEGYDQAKFDTLSYNRHVTHAKYEKMSAITNKI